MFILDRYFHILTFSIDKVHLSWGISDTVAIKEYLSKVDKLEVKYV